MKIPIGRIVFGAWSSGAKNRVALGNNFRLNKQVAERRMNFIGDVLSHHNFRITGDIQFTAFSGTIGNADSSKLNVIFR